MGNFSTMVIGIMANTCHYCNKRAVCRVNNKVYVCGDHAEQLAIASLRVNSPVVMACQGEPQYLLIPAGVGHGNN